MHPETRATLNRLRKSRVVKRFAVGAAGVLTYTLVMNRYGYRMVRPERIVSSGELVFVTVTGKILQPAS